MTKKLLLFIITALSLIGCQYKFSDDYFNEIEITDPTASISLLNFTNEQSITKYTDINFKYNGDNRHRLYEIKFYINNSLISTHQSEEGSFPIDIYNLDEGSHNLKIEYYFSSGSGSLAEYSGLEAYKAIENFTFYIDKSVADAFSVNKVEIVDGSIYIHWNDVIDNNFNEAYLAIKKNGFLNKEILLSPEEISKKIYNDTINTSGNLAYYIKVKNDFNTSQSNESEISIEPLDISYNIVDYNTINLSWKKHQVYNNFDYYFFESSLNNYERLKLDKNGGNLIINKNLLFGELYQFSMRFIRERPYVDFIDSASRQIILGEDFDKKYCTNYIYNPSNNKIYALELVGPTYYQATRTVFIHELNSLDLSVIKTTEIMKINEAYVNLSIEPNTQNLVLDFNDQSIVLDINTYNIIEKYNPNDYLNDLPYSFYSINRGNTYVIRGLSQTDTTYIYNSTTKQLLKSFPFRVYFFKISGDGKYFTLNDSIYKIENNSIIKLTSTINGRTINSIEFAKNTAICFYSTGSGPSVLYDLNSQTKTYIDELKHSYALSFDESTNKLLSYQQFSSSSPFLEVLDLNSNEKIKIRIQNIHYTNTYYTLENNNIIYSPGKYLKLE